MKLQTTVHHLLPELSDAEVDRSGLGPRFNLSEIKTGIQEDAPPSLSICIARKECAELNLWRFKQHTVILYCGYSLIKSDGCKPEDKSQSHATDSDQCLLSLELPCISLLKVYGGCL